MANSQITQVVSTVLVTSVEKIVIADIASDSNSLPVRSIKVYGQPNGVQGDPVFILQLGTDVHDKLLITTPATTF